MVEPSAVVSSEGFSKEQIAEAVERATGRFVDLLRSLDATDAGKPVPGMEWDVAQTAAHLNGIVLRGIGDRRRAPSVAELGALNLKQIEELDERDLKKIADILEESLQTQFSLLPHATGDEAFELHAGLYADLRTALSYQLWDFLLHGVDIASATGRAWTIESADAALAIQAVLRPLEPWVSAIARAGSPKRVVFTFEQIAPAIAIAIGDGEYRVDLVEGAPEAVSVDPVEMLLALSRRAASPDPFLVEIASWFDAT